MDDHWQEHGPIAKPRPRSARVFVTPRCQAGVAFGAFAAGLEERGLDLRTVMIGPMDKRGRAELVRKISTVGAVSVYQRFDDTVFTYTAGIDQPAPEYAC